MSVKLGNASEGQEMKVGASVHRWQLGARCLGHEGGGGGTLMGARTHWWRPGCISEGWRAWVGARDT